MHILAWLWGWFLYALQTPARAQGASEERERSLREAERQEAEDDAVGRTAADGPDDPRDLLLERPR